MKRITNPFSFMLILLFMLVSTNVNAQYQANDDQATTIMNTPVIIHVRANDTYPFQYQTVDFIYWPPSNGTIEFIGDDILYVPNAGYTGTDDFFYALSTDGANLVDSGFVSVNVVADSDPNFHLNMVGITPASCTGGQLKVFIKNGTAPYVYQINGSVVTTILSDSIIVNNFISHTGTIQVTDANNNTVNTTFTVPNNQRLLCIDGPMSGYTLPNECLGNVSFGVWGGTPPFYAIGSSMQGPEQVPFMWEGDDSHSRRAYASNVCQGFYNLMVSDSNGLQVSSSFMVDTNSTTIPSIVTGIDTCIAITGYTSAYVSDVYTNANGTYAVWNIVLLSTDTVTLNVLYPIQNSGTYQFILYVNCPGGKSTVMLSSIYNVTYSDLIMSVIENNGFENTCIYPNPMTEKAMIRFNSNHSGTVEITVFNIIGKEVAHYSFNGIQGVNTFELNVGNLAKGTYLIQLTDNQLNKSTIKVSK